MISVLGELELPDPTTLELPDVVAQYSAIRREHAQLLNLIGVLDGMKPCLDDWIPVSRFDEFRSLCDENDLHLRAGIQFDSMSHEDAERVIGANTLTTTRARATPVGNERGSVHVFVGRDPEVVEQTFLAGWYPLVVGDRASSKPWIDHIWFGEGLGYPRCCLRAFAANNNWAVNNMPYQAARATRRPSALCNSIMRFTGLTWAPHLPCSYDCAATETRSTQLRDITRGIAPQLADLVDTLTTGCFLLLSEWEAFVLHRPTIDGQRVTYESVSLAPSNRPNLELFEALSAGDHIEVRDDLVVVFRDRRVVAVEECRTEGFAPRVPVILDFAAPT